MIVLRRCSVVPRDRKKKEKGGGGGWYECASPEPRTVAAEREGWGG